MVQGLQIEPKNRDLNAVLEQGRKVGPVHWAGCELWGAVAVRKLRRIERNIHPPTRRCSDQTGRSRKRPKYVAARGAAGGEWVLQARMSSDYSKWDNFDEDNQEQLYGTTGADKASVDYSKFDTTVQAVEKEEERDAPRKFARLAH